MDWNGTAHSAGIRYQEGKRQQTQREDDDSGDGKRQAPRVFDKGASDERASNVTNAVMWTPNTHNKSWWRGNEFQVKSRYLYQIVIDFLMDLFCSFQTNFPRQLRIRANQLIETDQLKPIYVYINLKKF